MSTSGRDLNLGVTARDRSGATRWIWEAQAVLSWAVVLILVALLGTIYVYSASRTATVGRSVQALQYEISELKRREGLLQSEISAAQTLGRLQEDAARLGFQRAEPGDIVYIVVEEVGPVKVAVPDEEPVEAPAPPTTIGDALRLVVTEAFTNFVRGDAS